MRSVHISKNPPTLWDDPKNRYSLLTTNYVDGRRTEKRLHCTKKLNSWIKMKS